VPGGSFRFDHKRKIPCLAASGRRRNRHGGFAVVSLARANAQGDEPMNEQGLQDPVSKYPKPPYKKQSQPWPGLACKMEPRPDHGESSYRGSGRLAGRKALITGGDSGMGRAAAIAYAREGADVAINYFPSEEPDAREVIDLIKAEGASDWRYPVTCGTRNSVGNWSIERSRVSAAWI
jgi:hypothetical protein